MAGFKAIRRVAVEERYDRNHHAGGTPAERIRNLKSSAEPQRGDGAQVTAGSGPNRTITTIHPRGNMRQHGGVRRGEERK
jgi:hypothetical protein